MKRIFIILLLGFLITSCGPASLEVRKAKYDSMANFLPYVNQKVRGYIQAYDVADYLNEGQYREILEIVCYRLPSCRKEAEKMFNIYHVKVRRVNDMFTVMLCDIGEKEKIMEDLSCNENMTEIRSYEKDVSGPCEFERDWKEIMKKYCKY